MNKKVATFDNGIMKSMDATELATRIKNKEISAKEVIECSIQRAKLCNPTINAIAHANLDIHMDAFPAIPTKGIFAGVPTYAKDLIDVEGHPTRHGSRATSNKIARKNEKITQQILSTGCCILGKSTTSEFGLLPAVETLLQGPTRNPLNTDYSTGGSSGGAAALVSAGVVPFAHAADGGGSIRIPASCCGLVGLKPSRGRDIDSPTAMLPIDIVSQGILSRSVRDTANYHYAIEQFHPAAKLPSIGLVEGPSSKRLKIGLYTQTPSGIPCHDSIQKATLQAAKFCEGLGHHVEWINAPFPQETKIDFLAYWSFLTYMLRRFGRFSFGFSFQKSKLENFSTQMAKVYPKLLFDTPKIVKRLKNFSREYAGIYDSYDIIMNPVLSQPVPRIGYFGPENNFFSFIEKLSQYVNYTTVQNITGTPSISLPMAKDEHNLPIGIQFSAALGQDRKLLELAFEIEQQKGFIPWFKA